MLTPVQQTTLRNNGILAKLHKLILNKPNKPKNGTNQINQMNEIDQINQTNPRNSESSRLTHLRPWAKIMRRMIPQRGNKKTEPKRAPSLIRFIGGLKDSNYPRSSMILADELPACKTYSPQLTLAFCFAQLSHSLLNRCLERKERLHFKHILLSRRLWVSLANIGSLLDLSNIYYQWLEQGLPSTIIESQ